MCVCVCVCVCVCACMFVYCMCECVHYYGFVGVGVFVRTCTLVFLSHLPLTSILSSSTLQFTSISKSTPILTNKDTATSEEHMDQSTADRPGEDGNSNCSVEPPVCAPADSTTPDGALWVEDRTPNKTTVIEDDDQEDSDSKRKKEEDRHEALFKVSPVVHVDRMHVHTYVHMVGGYHVTVCFDECVHVCDV